MNMRMLRIMMPQRSPWIDFGKDRMVSRDSMAMYHMDRRLVVVDTCRKIRSGSRYRFVLGGRHKRMERTEDTPNTYIIPPPHYSARTFAISEQMFNLI
jgi:hypothetical protein